MKFRERWRIFSRTKRSTASPLVRRDKIDAGIKGVFDAIACNSPAKCARERQKKSGGEKEENPRSRWKCAMHGTIASIIDSISFSISRDFRRHYRREDRLRTLDSTHTALFPSIFRIIHSPRRSRSRARATRQEHMHRGLLGKDSGI